MSSGDASGETATTSGADSNCDTVEDCNPGLLCIDGICEPCTAADDADLACGRAYSEQPLCDADGRCVACVPDSCSGSSPVCDPQRGCVACSEHDQCPDSACHLAGPDTGACFDLADVVDVQVPGAFAELLAEVGPGQDRVFRLGAATYTFPVDSDADIYDVDGEREIALLGNGATVLEGSAGANTQFVPVPGEDASQIYLSRVEWNGVPAGQSSFVPVLWAGPGTELWVDDATTRGTLNVAGGTVHLRRSNVFGGAGIPFGHPDATLQGQGTLYLENTSVDPALEHIRFDGVLDVRYSTLVIEGSMLCGDAVDGVVRNSIVLTGGEIAEACEGAAWSGDAVNTAGFGTAVPAVDQAWFAPSSDVRFRLGTQGAEIFGDLATWAEGDPVLDAQGDARPMRGQSAAGVDEP